MIRTYVHVRFYPHDSTLFTFIKFFQQLVISYLFIVQFRHCGKSLDGRTLLDSFHGHRKNGREEIVATVATVATTTIHHPHGVQARQLLRTVGHCGQYCVDHAIMAIRVEKRR